MMRMTAIKTAPFVSMIFSLLLSQQAQADMDAGVSFDKLTAAFGTSSMPTTGELGWNVSGKGICVSKTRRFIPTGVVADDTGLRHRVRYVNVYGNSPTEEYQVSSLQEVMSADPIVPVHFPAYEKDLSATSETFFADDALQFSLRYFPRFLGIANLDKPQQQLFKLRELPMNMTTQDGSVKAYVLAETCAMSRCTSVINKDGKTAYFSQGEWLSVCLVAPAADVDESVFQEMIEGL